MEGTFSTSYLDSFIRMPIFWDADVSCKNLQIDEYMQTATSINSESSFKTALGKYPFTPGYRYFFEVKMVQGTNFKVGVATP
jgi:hypothetical protein